jgi:hypothetical protein
MRLSLQNPPLCIAAPQYVHITNRTDRLNIQYTCIQKCRCQVFIDQRTCCNNIDSEVAPPVPHEAEAVDAVVDSRRGCGGGDGGRRCGGHCRVFCDVEATALAQGHKGVLHRENQLIKEPGTQDSCLSEKQFATTK